MSEKDNFSDLVGNRSSQSSSSDFTKNRPGDNETNSYESLDFYDSTDFSNHVDYADDNSGTVDELIDGAEVTEVVSSPDENHRNFSITGPDDELEFVAHAEHIAHENHENFDAHRDYEIHEDNEAPAGHEDYESHEDYEIHDEYEKDEPPVRPRPSRSDPDFVAHPPRYSHRAADSVVRPTSHAPAQMISDFQPASRKPISTASIHSSGKKSKPEFADDIITISTFEATSEQEPAPRSSHDGPYDYGRPSRPSEHHERDSADETEVFKSQPTSKSRDVKAKDAKTKDIKSKSEGPRKKSNHFAVGLVCIILALIVAGVGIAIAVKLINDQKNQPGQGNSQDQPETPSTSVVTDDNTTLSFLQLENNKKNLIYSPLSIRSGLALLDAGADGNTKTQITKILGSTEVPQYQSVEGELSLANGIFIRDDYRSSILDSYINTVTDNQNAQLIFGDLTESLVNQWAKDNTLGLIDNLGVTPTENTKVILANALAIKMDWEYQFDSASTRSKDFYTTDNKKISASTMSRTFSTSDVLYAKNENETIVSLPLSSKSTANLEFAAIMPSTDLADYIEELTPADLQETLNSLTPASSTSSGIDVDIPKFKFDYELDFKKDLGELGIINAFNPGTANFSKLSTSRLYVNDAVHKANIDFSETGIKAAAVTTFSLDVTSAMVEEELPIALTFDHPFLFVIRDRANDAVWFTGTVYTPTTD